MLLLLNFISITVMELFFVTKAMCFIENIPSEGTNDEDLQNELYETLVHYPNFSYDKQKQLKENVLKFFSFLGYSQFEIAARDLRNAVINARLQSRVSNDELNSMARTICLVHNMRYDMLS